MTMEKNETITILDTETTGVSNEDLVVEVAAILYNLRLATPITTFATLLPLEGQGKGASPNGISAEEVTGISTEMLQATMHDSWPMARDVVTNMASFSRCILAHNAAFDKRFVDSSKLLNGYSAQWVCSMRHIRWPKRSGSQSLQAIALAHGVPILSAHRAWSDCDVLARLLTRVNEMGHSLIDLFNAAVCPRFMVKALVDYDRRKLAQSAGFEWNSEEHPKTWTKEVTEDELKNLPFQCVKL